MQVLDAVLYHMLTRHWQYGHISQLNILSDSSLEAQNISVKQHVTMCHSSQSDAPKHVLPCVIPVNQMLLNMLPCVIAVSQMYTCDLINLFDLVLWSAHSWMHHDMWKTCLKEPVISLSKWNVNIEICLFVCYWWPWFDWSCFQLLRPELWAICFTCDLVTYVRNCPRRICLGFIWRWLCGLMEH